MTHRLPSVTTPQETVDSLVAFTHFHPRLTVHHRPIHAHTTTTTTHAASQSQLHRLKKKKKILVSPRIVSLPSLHRHVCLPPARPINNQASMSRPHTPSPTENTHTHTHTHTQHSNSNHLPFSACDEAGCSGEAEERPGCRAERQGSGRGRPRH